MGYTIKDIQAKYPDLKLFRTAKRKRDGRIFKSGDEIKCGKLTYKIIAFDHYDYPLPISNSDTPFAVNTTNKFITKIYKTKFDKQKRAIVKSIVSDFMFLNIEEIR